MSGKPVKDAIEAIYKPIESLVKTLAGPAAEEIGLSFRDSVQAWRLKRQIRLFKRVQEICVEAGIKPQAVRLPFLFDVVDRASLEEDDSLQDRWANLLANAASGVEGLVGNAFPDILRQLSNAEAIYLEYLLHRRYWRGEKTQRFLLIDKLQPFFPRVSLDRIRIKNPLPFIDEVQAENVRRLGLIELAAEEFPAVSVSDTFLGKAKKNEWILTPLGVAFVRACTAPKSKRKK